MQRISMRKDGMDALQKAFGNSGKEDQKNTGNKKRSSKGWFDDLLGFSNDLFGVHDKGEDAEDDKDQDHVGDVELNDALNKVMKDESSQQESQVGNSEFVEDLKHSLTPKSLKENSNDKNTSGIVAAKSDKK